MPQTWPCDRVSRAVLIITLVGKCFYLLSKSPCAQALFWSKTRKLMHSYAAVVGQFWTLEDTLVGYMFNDLIWCAQEEDSGMESLLFERLRCYMLLLAVVFVVCSSALFVDVAASLSPLHTHIISFAVMTHMNLAHRF